MSDQNKKHPDVVWPTDWKEHYRRTPSPMESLQVARFLDIVDIPHLEAIFGTLPQVQGDVRERRDGAELGEKDQH